MNKLEFEKKLMGTRVNITIYTSRNEEEVFQSAQNAFATFEKLEKQFSIFLEDSEINYINKNAGKILKVSPLMLETVAYALNLAKETDGIFNPLLGNLTKPGGASRNFDRNAFREILIDNEHQTLLIPSGTELDLNSVVKGMAIDLALESFADEENLMIEAGGDLRIKGLPPGADSWKIGIRNPLEPAKILTVLKLKAGAICTSGKYFREAKAIQEKRHHLVEPENNAEKNALSMTVTAPTAKEADALSTAAFFMPMGRAVELVESYKGAACLMIDHNNEVFASNQMRSNFALT